jgi:hypothetical protein
MDNALSRPGNSPLNAETICEVSLGLCGDGHSFLCHSLCRPIGLGNLRPRCRPHEVLPTGSDRSRATYDQNCGWRMNLEKRSDSVKRAGIVFLFLLSVVSACRCADAQASSAGKKLVLTDGWYIQPSPDVTEKGSILSTAAFQRKHWYRATMPSTVLAALAADRVYADPYFGMNLRSIPGTSYTIGTTFSGIPMPLRDLKIPNPRTMSSKYFP